MIVAVYVRECSACFLRVVLMYVSHLSLRFVIHFEFIFKHGVRECSNLIILYVVVVQSLSSV